MESILDPYRYCPLCGGLLEQFHDDERERKHCPQCGWIRYRNPTVGVALLVIRNDEVLLGQRRDGRWCVPCGHVEWDEDIRSAAMREGLEELGVELSVGVIAAVHSNFHDPQAHTVGIWFQTKLEPDSQPVAGGDLQDIAYFPLSNLPELAFPTDRRVLEQLRL